MTFNSGLKILEKVPLADYTSWQVGGPAEFFCLPENKEQIQEAIRWSETRGLNLTILGGGSNVLIADAGIPGLTICMRRFSKTLVTKDTQYLFIQAYSGTGKSDLLKIFLQEKLAPALFLAGLPGDVGGGVVMNAGVSENIVPREFNEIVEWVDVLKWDINNFWIQRYFHKNLQWHYRHSEGWGPGIVVEVGFRWPKNFDPQILEKVRTANRNRLAKQPLDLPSCGSVFKNPEGSFKAAQLIDSCGLKGFRIGDAQVSTKHANFIVNLGQARASDIWTLICQVQQKVAQEKGVSLSTEVIKLGHWIPN